MICGMDPKYYLGLFTFRPSRFFLIFFCDILIPNKNYKYSVVQFLKFHGDINWFLRLQTGNVQCVSVILFIKPTRIKRVQCSYTCKQSYLLIKQVVAGIRVWYHTLSFQTMFFLPCLVLSPFLFFFLSLPLVMHSLNISIQITDQHVCGISF